MGSGFEGVEITDVVCVLRDPGLALRAFRDDKLIAFAYEIREAGSGFEGAETTDVVCAVGDPGLALRAFRDDKLIEFAYEIREFN